MLLQCEEMKKSLTNNNLSTAVQESLLLSSPPFPWHVAYPSCVPLGWESDSISPFKRKRGGLQRVVAVLGSLLAGI